MEHDEDDELSTFMALRLDPTPRAEVHFRLVVRDGPDAGASFIVDDRSANRFLLGTSASCAARLIDRSVSRRHVAFDVDGDRLHLVDLGSKNGTRVESLAVREVWLTGGERINVGATVIEVSTLPAAPEGDGVVDVDHRFGRLLGVSRQMRLVFPLLKRLAATDLSVLLEGEIGTGKETTARTLHEAGPRAERPFVTLECTGLDEAAMNAELATVLASANGGTLFVDEIGELGLGAQAKLRRALGEGHNVRVVAATRMDLDDAIARNRFRDDLYHRVAVARVELPPLRLRRGDLPFLVAHFCRELGGDPRALPATLIEDWQAHRWPGNLRELRNAVAQRLVLGELSQLDSAPRSVATHDFIETILERRLVLADARSQVVEAFERRYVETMLRSTNGNVVRAAAASGVARRYFQILKARLGL